jgi:hypothetical protein
MPYDALKAPDPEDWLDLDDNTPWSAHATTSVAHKAQSAIATTAAAKRRFIFDDAAFRVTNRPIPSWSRTLLGRR